MARTVPPFAGPLAERSEDAGPPSSDGSLVPRVEEVDFLRNRFQDHRVLWSYGTVAPSPGYQRNPSRIHVNVSLIAYGLHHLDLRSQERSSAEEIALRSRVWLWERPPFGGKPKDNGLPSQPMEKSRTSGFLGW